MLSRHQPQRLLDEGMPSGLRIGKLEFEFVGENPIMTILRNIPCTRLLRDDMLYMSKESTHMMIECLRLELL